MPMITHKRRGAFPKSFPGGNRGALYQCKPLTLQVFRALLKEESK